MTLIRGGDNFKSVNFGEEAEQGEYPGKNLEDLYYVSVSSVAEELYAS